MTPFTLSLFDRFLGGVFVLSKIGRSCVYALVGLAALPTLNAQTDRPDSTLTLLGGWDFNGSTATSATSLNARYSQSQATGTAYYVSGTATNPGSAAFGTAYFSGSNGATFASARALNSGSASTVNYDLLSTVGLLAANNSLGDQSTNARAIQLSLNTVSDAGRATFKVSSLSTFDTFSGIKLDYQARNIGTAGNNATITWSYSTDGLIFTSLPAVTNQINPSTLYAVFSADFSAITALNGQSSIWLGLNYTESAQGAHVFIDNLAIYGTSGVGSVTPPPSGSLTFWKGGTGAWTAATTPTEWRDSAGTVQSAWNSGTAVFRAVDTITPGTVTIDAAGVIVTGLQFTTTGYTIAGTGAGGISTTTAATPVQVSTGATATISAVISGTGGLSKTDPGTLVLSGANTYTGATAVTAGTLTVNSVQPTATGAVSVASGATLGGTGTLGGAVTVADGGILASVGAGTLTMPTLTLGGTSILNLTLGAVNTVPLFQVNGAITLDGTLNVTGGSGFVAGLYRLFDYTGPLANLTNLTLVGGTLPTGFTVTIQTDVANRVSALFAAAAEPVGLTFWKGGVGTWTAATTPAEWRDSAGTVQSAWNSGTAVFRTVTAATPGTVTVDAAGVVVTGLQFTTTGYTIAGTGTGGISTTTAATPVLVASGATATISAVISGTGGLSKTDTGTLVLSGANTYTGATAVTAGTLTVNGVQPAATGAVSVASGATLGGTGTLGGAVTVANGGILASVGAGTLTMPSLTLGATSILNLTFGAVNTVPLFQINGAFTLDGTLNVTGGTGFVAGLYRLFDYTGPLANLTNNTLLAGTLPTGFTVTIQTGVANQVSALFAADSVTPPPPPTTPPPPPPTTPPPPAPTQALTAWTGGAGTWTAATTSTGWRSADGTQSGPWTPGLATFGGTAGTVTVDNAAGAVAFNELRFTATGYTVAGGTLTTTTAATPVLVSTGATATVSSVIAGSGGLNKTEAGTLILSGNHTYTGGTTVTAGTLQIGNAGTAGSVVGNITNNAVVSFNRTDSATVAGVIGGTGAVTQAGTGTTILTGTNTYAGGTTIGAGILQIGAGGTTGSITGNVTNNGALAVNRSDAVTLANVVSGTGALRQIGAGTTTLTGANTYTGGTTVTTGTLRIGAGGTTGAITGDVTNNATLALNRSDALTLGGVIGGTGAVQQIGAGTTTLGGANIYTGATTVSAGTLLINGNSVAATGAVTVSAGAALGGTGTTGGAVTVANGATLVGTGGSTFTTGALILNDTSRLNVALGAPGGRPVFQVNGNATLDGVVNVANAGGLAVGTYRLLDYTGTLTNNTLRIGNAAINPGDISFTAAASNPVNLVVAATVNDYWTGGVGTWTADVAGTAWQRIDATGAGAWAGRVATFQGTAGIVTADNTAGAVNLTGAQFLTTGYTVAGGTLTTSTAGIAIQVGNASAAGAATTATISSVIAGTGGINKTDLGTLTLGGVNIYTGATTVSAGTLNINGDQSAAASAVTVAAGARLGGTGSVGAVSVASGATLLGTAGSMLTMTSLGLVDGSRIAVTLGGPSTSGLFQVNGALTLDGTLDVTGTAGFGAGLYRLFNYTGALTNNTLNVGTLPGTAYIGTVQTSVSNQINFLVDVGPLPVWTGGSGTWSANTSGTGFNSADGVVTGGAWKPGMAIFQGSAGTVTVDSATTPVEITGLQFAVNGYTVTGGALTTNTANTLFRVGDGTSAGATMTGTIASVINGTGGIEKNDLGTLVLSGNNTNTGGTTVTAGTLQIGAGGTTGAVNGDIVNNAVVRFNRSNDATVAGAITGSGAVTQAGSGTVIFTGANTYTGGTTVSAGTLQIGAGGTSGGIAGNIANSGIVTFNRSNAVTYDGAISGAGALTQAGTGTTVLTGTNTLAGGTTIAAGTLQIGSGGTTGSLAGAVANNGTLAVNRSDAVTLAGPITGTGALRQLGAGATTLTGANAYTGGTVISAGTLQIGSGGTTGGLTGAVVNNGTLAVNRSDAFTLDGAISGTGALTKLGSGTTTLAANNTFSGTTTITAGTLQVGTGGTAGSLGAGAVVNNGTLALNRSDAMAIDGVISGTGALRQAGSGTTTLTANNTYSGGTTITAGTLQVGTGGTTGAIAGAVTNNGTLAINRSDAVTLAGAITGTGTLRQSGAGTTTLTGANLFTGGTAITAGTLQIGSGGTAGSLTGAVVNNGALAVNRSDAITLDGAISGTGSLRQAGAGTTTLTGAATHTGGTTITTGTLQIGSGGATGSLAGAVVNNATLAINRVDNATLDGPISGTGALRQTGAGTTVLTGTNTYAGGTTITAGTLQIGAGGTAGSLAGAVNTGTATGSGALAINRSDTVTLANVVSGAGSLRQAGAGTTILTGANVYTGGTVISAGTLQVGAGGTAGALGTGAITNNATLAINRGDAFSLDGAITGTGALVQSGAGTTTLTGVNTHTGGTTINAGTLQIGSGGSTGSLAGNVVNNGTLAINRSDALALNGVISGSGAVTKLGAGTATLTGVNSFAGGTTVTAGVLQVSDNNALGAANGAITLGGGTLRAGGAVTTGRTINVTAASTIDTGANLVVASGMLTGTGALTKTGTGELRVSGANTAYTGATTVSQGAIRLDGGNLAAATIASGAFLTGNGGVRGALVNNGTLSPGASPGTITVTGNYTQGATGNFAAELASATSFDKLVVDGNATLAGSLTVSGLNGFVPDAGQTFGIIEATGTRTGTFTTLVSPWGNLSPMLRFEALYGAKDVKLSMTQLPFANITNLTGNQKAVGDGIDGAIKLKAIPDLQKALNALPTTARVGDALTQLSPQRYERWFEQAVYNTGANIRVVEQRMDQLTREPKAGLWTEVVRRDSKFDATSEKTKAKAGANGIMIGGDARVTPDLQVGAVFGYTAEKLDLDENGSATDAKRFTGAVYARYDLAPWYVDAVAGGSHADLDGRRVIAVPGYAGVADIATKSRDAYASVRSGYTFQLGRAKLTPYAGGQYVRWATDAATETGAKQANLKVLDQSRDSLASRAGLTVAFPFAGEEISFTPRIDVAWRHEFRTARQTVIAEIGGSPFTLPGADFTQTAAASALGLNQTASGDQKRDGVVASLGFDVTFGSRLTAYLRVVAEAKTATTQAIEVRAGSELRF